MAALDIHTTDPALRTIKPKQGFSAVNVSELWRYRELFLFLAWRDLLIRYKQTVLGILWAILQPLTSVAVFTIVFGKMAGLDANGAPYPLLTLAAMIPWQMFSGGLAASSLSLVSSANLVTKIYFPRLIIPLSSTFGTLLDALIGLILLLLTVGFYLLAGSQGWVTSSATVGLHWQILLTPLWFLLGLLTTIAAGLWLSALNVKYRDIKYVVPFMIRIAMLISPIGYLSTEIPQPYRLIYSINPLVGVIDGFRWSVLGNNFEPYWPGMAVSALATLFLLVSGLLFFRNTERRFADII